MEALLLQMLLGAAMGATTSAITGDDPGQGALRGAGGAGMGHALGGSGSGNMFASGSSPTGLPGDDWQWGSGGRDVGMTVGGEWLPHGLGGDDWQFGSGRGADWNRALELFSRIGNRGQQQVAQASNMPRVINPRPLFLPKVGPDSYWK